jgi:uncharacterized protein YwgA
MTEKSWIAKSVESLNSEQSWTGRTYIHKQLFIAQVLELGEVPFRFELYHFGPYSFEVDHLIAEMEAFGELEKRYTSPGYGPRYSTTSLANSDLADTDSEALDSIASAIRNFNSVDLELIATCLWVERREGESVDDVITDRVKEIKPKYSSSQIQHALAQARSLARELV